MEDIQIIYSQLADLIIESIPKKWDKAWAYIEYDQSGNNEIYTCFLESGTLFSKKKIHDFEIDGWKLIDLFNLIRNDSPLKEKWSSATYTINNKDKFEIDFDYSDLEKSNAYDRRVAWEKKYL